MDFLKLIKPVSKHNQNGIENYQPKTLDITPFKPVGAAVDNLVLVNDKLYQQGQDINDLIIKTANQQPHLLGALSTQIEEFKKERIRKRNLLVKSAPKNQKTADTELSKIIALCDAHIGQISRQIQKRYNQTKDGFDVLFDEENQLILNGMNINAYIEQCKKNKNEKSLLLLKGIRQRLELVLQNKSESQQYERIRDVIVDLFKNIDTVL